MNIGLVLVTGASGFVGRALCARLAMDGVTVRGMWRRPEDLPGGTDSTIGEVGPATDWSDALRDIDVVVHLAARAHVLRETDSDPISRFRSVNALGTARLAEACVQRGVRRLVFVSTIGVHGANSAAETFTESSPIRPATPYAQSKWEAETALHEAATGGALKTVVIRSPLIHGPYVRGNFLRLLGWVERGVPLPFASIHNSRSFIGIANLVDMIVLSCSAPAAAGETFVVCDAEDVSTADLLRRIGDRLERRARLFPFPAATLRAAARILGRGEDAERLFGSLRVDASKAQRVLGWSPRRTLDQGLDAMCTWYKTRK